MTTDHEWVRVSAGHYDSADGQYRIDTCSANKRRWDLSKSTTDPAYSEPFWNEFACVRTLAEAKDAAYIDANLDLYLSGKLDRKGA